MNVAVEHAGDYAQTRGPALHVQQYDAVMAGWEGSDAALKGSVSEPLSRSHYKGVPKTQKQTPVTLTN